MAKFIREKCEFIRKIITPGTKNIWLQLFIKKDEERKSYGLKSKKTRIKQVHKEMET